MNDDHRTYQIIGAAMEVHKTLGCGFTEYVYQDALEVEMQRRGIPFEREKHFRAIYKGVELKHDYIADFLCFDDVILELKAVNHLAPEHRAQIINYLKISNHKVGLLLNFGDSSLRTERYSN